MVSSLRCTAYKLFGEIDYLHYYRRMINDFVIRQIWHKNKFVKLFLNNSIH